MALLSSDTHQLDRLGRELKCPICLSLFKEAASLTCNHTFCRSCITQSMKSNPACPICKVHTTRREVRAAPQMDSLVSIFVSMGGAAGLDIMASQNVTSTINEGVQESKNKAGASRRIDALSNITNCQDSIKTSKRKTKSPEVTFKGPIPAKKRIQVPQPSTLEGELEAHRDDNHCTPRLSADKCEQEGLSGGSKQSMGKRQIKRKGFPNETEVAKCVSSSRKVAKRAKKLSSEQACSKVVNTEAIGKGVVVQTSIELDSSPPNVKRTRKRKGKDVAQLACSQPSSHHAQQGSAILEKDDSSRRKLDPFFWLRDESSQDTEAMQVTQLTLTQSTARPNFSDLKDSDDDQPADANEEFSNRIGVCGPSSYDSDDFDWTQLPCSPEIRCSPSKNQGPQSDLVVDLPLEAPQLPAIEGPTLNDQDLHESLSQETISTKSLLESASRVDLVAQENLNMFLKENKNGRKSGRAESALPMFEESLVNVRISQNGKRERKRNHVENSKGSSQFTPNITLPQQEVQFNIKACSTKKTEKLKKPCSSKMDSNKNKDAEDKKTQNGQKEVENAAKLRLSTCVFCGSSKCSQITGPMMHYNQEGTPLEWPELNGKVVHVHKHCAEWAPDVYFVEDQAKNLNAEAARGVKIKCSSCGKRGAALGCCIKRCRKSYHYPCARTLSCSWEEERFIMLCPEHKAENFPMKKRRQRGLRRAAQRSELKKADPGHSSGPKEPLPKWACAQSSKWLLCGSALDSDGKDQLATFAKTVGATVSKAWSSNVTHVIAGVDQQGAARRTMKYLMAILEGKWILKMEWLVACLEAGYPVSEEPFEIGIDIHGAIGGPKKGRYLASSKALKLFETMQFYFMPDFSPSYKADLQALVVSGGGLILHRKPVLLETDAGQRTTLVVYNNESASNGQKVDDRKMSKRQEESKSLAECAGACVIPHQWILDSIASSKVLAIE